MSFMKLITRAKVSTPPWNIHTSKLVETIIVDARFGKTYWWSMVLLTMVGKTSSTKKTEKEIKHEGFGVTLTFEAKYSHKWTKACNSYKYIAPNPPKIIVVVHHFFVGVCGTKKCNNCIARWTCSFLPRLLNMSSKFCHLLIKLMFPLSKQP